MKIQANHTTQYGADNENFQDTKEKDDDPLEDSNLVSFEEDNYIERHKRCL